MVEVKIEYCVECGLLEPAIETQRALLQEFGGDVDAVRLVPGGDGVFTVTVGTETIFDRAEHGTRIDLTTVTDAIEQRLGDHVSTK